MKNNKYIPILIIISVLLLVGLSICFHYYIVKGSNDNNYNKNTNENNTKEIVTKDILITTVGDCTIGTDPNFGYQNSFIEVFNNNNKDYSYFFSKTLDVFKNDDLSIANMEGTFTTSNERADKTFTFKGDLDYAKVFTEGSIEVVNLANNHTYDFGNKGFDDTLSALNHENIKYFGFDNYLIYEVKGLKIGLAGITYYDNDTEANGKLKTDKAIEYLKEKEADLIFISYHWGIEHTEEQNDAQRVMGKYAIDKGADLVIGHGPHRLQGIDEYKGKYIIYSLANFVFGGNKNPSYKDTMIFQEKFHYENNILTETTIKIIPAQVSGVLNTNDYRPIILEGSKKEEVLNKILNVSNIKYKETE